MGGRRHAGEERSAGIRPGGDCSTQAGGGRLRIIRPPPVQASSINKHDAHFSRQALNDEKNARQGVPGSASSSVGYLDQLVTRRGRFRPTAVPRPGYGNNPQDVRFWIRPGFVTVILRHRTSTGSSHLCRSEVYDVIARRTTLCCVNLSAASPSPPTQIARSGRDRPLVPAVAASGARTIALSGHRQARRSTLVPLALEIDLLSGQRIPASRAADQQQARRVQSTQSSRRSLQPERATPCRPAYCR